MLCPSVKKIPLIFFLFYSPKLKTPCRTNSATGIVMHLHAHPGGIMDGMVRISLRCVPKTVIPISVQSPMAKCIFHLKASWPTGYGMKSPVPEWPGPEWWETHPPRPRFRNQGKNTISSIVGSYKSAVTKQAHLLGYEMAWQPRFYDHIIRDADEWRRIKFYIQNNVKNWGKK